MHIIPKKPTDKQLSLDARTSRMHHCNEPYPKELPITFIVDKDDV